MTNLSIRRDFPIFHKHRHWCYLDNAATTQKPAVVIEELTRFYRDEYATVHRGVYDLSAKATLRYEQSRADVADFMGADSAENVVFTRGATESLNLVAAGLAHLCNAGDEILITAMEHHANIVPWQQLCQQKNMTLKVVPLNDLGAVDDKVFASYLTDKTKIVSFTHVSNVLGTVNPLCRWGQLAKERGAWVVVDGAQAAAHLPLNVKEWPCDFYVFSGHKVYAPMGIGVLYGRSEALLALQPYQTGGGMIEQVQWQQSQFLAPPHCFEAGTPNVSGALALSCALRYLSSFDRQELLSLEQKLLSQLQAGLATIPGLKVYGQAADKVGVVAITLQDVHPHDLATYLDSHNIAVRAGHHCTMPMHQDWRVAATLRISLAVYNTGEDIERVLHALKQARVYFQVPEQEESCV